MHFIALERSLMPSVVDYTFNVRMQDTETGASLWVLGYPVLHSELQASQDDIMILSVNNVILIKSKKSTSKWTIKSNKILDIHNANRSLLISFKNWHKLHIHLFIIET